VAYGGKTQKVQEGCHPKPSLAMERQPGRTAEGNFIYILKPALARQLLDEIKTRGMVTP